MHDFSKVHRLVVKIGSSTLTGPQGLASAKISRLAGQLARAHKEGREVVLISSGAIAAGVLKVCLEGRPKTIRQKQACAAVGQAGLMNAWERPLARHGVKTAQILLTADDLAHRRRFLNARNTLATLLEWRIIPIVNENDTVATDEIKVGDNDTLGALVAGLVEADLFVNLTDTDGLYDSDPRTNPRATLITEVEKVDARIMALAGGVGSPVGAGGMYTKVRAAKRLSEQGLPSVIAGSRIAGVIDRLLAGEPVGTYFHPQPQRRPGKKNWLAFAARPKGDLMIDEGAGNALLNNGKSLLPSGLIEARGSFVAGDPVRIVGFGGELLAVGLTNYARFELDLIVGCRSCEIEKRLGAGGHYSDEVVHRDNLVLAGGLI